jgi:LytS/YehU family sensor histidine kinase
MILQPLVENAVTHGIGRNKGSDTITIRGFRQETSLLLEVHNCNSTLEGPRGTIGNCGIGLTMTRERLEELYGKDRICLSIRKLEPRGVCASIRLPLRLNVEEHRTPTSKVLSS